MNSFIELFRHPEIFKMCDVNVNGYPGFETDDGWRYINTGFDNSISIAKAIKTMNRH